MIRTVLLGLVALALLPATAGAHPLGNFSVNHLSRVSVSADRVDVRYILDEGEIPTFQQRSASDSELLRRKRAEVERRLTLTVDGRRVALRAAGAGTIMHPPGQGGLETTRVELPLTAAVDAPRRVHVRDGTFPGRVGWKSVVVRPGEGTAVRSNVPAADPTNGLRSYPEDLLDSPADVRSATLSVTAGSGTVEAPDGTRSGAVPDRAADQGLTKVFGDAAAGEGVLLVLLLSAFAWGAIHALSPGHGKAMVAAYLVGTRGTARHAVALGGVVTATHTAGVFALGLVALLLSQYILPEQLYPWLNLVSGALVLVVGAAVLRSRIRWTRTRQHAHVRGHHDHSHDDHDHGEAHDHDHDHDHDHHHARGHDHRLVHSHGGAKPHSHAPPERLSWRGLVAMGAAAGLIPCPSALVVLLGAISQGQIALGMLLIVAFSAGLAATMTLLGVAVVYAGRALSRMPVPQRLTSALPAVSAVLIIGVGLVLTVQAVPQVA
jgi:ABC-type nickel/cobalt efflux system permease component RcnA